MINLRLVLRRLRGVAARQRKSSKLVSLRRLGLLGLAILAAHAGAMVYLEGLDWWTAVWLTVTTVTTVGYGDVSATTWPGQLTTMVLLYAGGVFIIAQAAGVFFEYHSERATLKKRGEWIWNMKDHIVVINTPAHNRTRFMERLFGELEATQRSKQRPEDALVAQTPKEYLLVTEAFPEGLPGSLEQHRVKLQAGRGDDPDTLGDANILEAAGVIILATDPFELEFSHDDSLTFDIIHRVREAGYAGYLVAEVVEPRNRERMLGAGANSVVLPVRAFPGLISRALFHPGMEEMIETLFDSQGNECISLTTRIDGERWREVIERFVRESQGTPIGYALEGEVVTEPDLESTVKADTVYVLTGGNRA